MADDEGIDMGEFESENDEELDVESLDEGNVVAMNNDSASESEPSENEDSHENGGNSDNVRVYLPNRNMNPENEKLECDEKAYVFYHEAKTGAPCLSFDIIQDDLGDDRSDKYPLAMTIVCGTQGEKSHVNNVIVMKMSNIHKSKSKSHSNEEDEESESESESEDGDSAPTLDCALIHHPGCVNRIRCTNLGDKSIAASWSERGKVFLWDLTVPLRAVNNPHAMANYIQNKEAPSPIFSFSGHQKEGYAVDWSPITPGVLATGDCNKNIHLWKPIEGGTWHVDQRPYSAHTASVEDIQWSPSESNVMASCSVDRTIRIWDVRAAPSKACMLTTENAHESDVNVINWNKFEPFILSGGDDGQLKVWDLRRFPDNSPICTFKHHVSYITSAQWHPKESSVFAASGSDDQLTLWDLAVERDMDAENSEVISKEILELPPQLLFIHQGQKEIKELHWHPQVPGVVISTAITGFNVFRTLSV